MDIIEFYSGLLKAAGLFVIEDAVYIDSDPMTPLTISGQHLVLPTKAILKDGVGDKRIGFHPLSESVSRKESIVLKRYRKCLTYRLNLVTATLLRNLMKIAVETDYHAKLSPDQSQFLKLIPKVKASTYKSLCKVLAEVKCDTVTRRLVSLYIKRGGLLATREYSRVCSVTFPVLDCIRDAEPEIFGVTLLQRDKAAIIELMKYILPDSDAANSYSCGTNQLIAPNLQSLIDSSRSIFEQLNKIVALYGPLVDPDGDLSTNLDYAQEEVTELYPKFRALIPELRGNAGEVMEAEDDDTTTTAPTEKKRPVIGYPAPEKERPAAPPQPIAQQGPVNQPPVNQSYNNGSAERPKTRNIWMQQLNQPPVQQPYQQQQNFQPPQNYGNQYQTGYQQQPYQQQNHRPPLGYDQHGNFDPVLEAYQLGQMSAHQQPGQFNAQYQAPYGQQQHSGFGTPGRAAAQQRAQHPYQSYNNGGYGPRRY